MDIEEAIEVLKLDIKFRGYVETSKVLEAHERGIEALEKQIRKMCICGGEPPETYPACPCCDAEVDEGMTVCHECGQALKWQYD